VIYEVSRSLSLRPTEASWIRAERAAKRLEETIFSLLGTGMNKEGFALSKMEERIKLAGPDGLPLSELTKAFHTTTSQCVTSGFRLCLAAKLAWRSTIRQEADPQ